MIALLRITLLVIFLALSGCIVQKNQKEIDRGLRAYYHGNFAGAAQEFQPLAEKTDENFVLNNLRLGSAQLVDYNLNNAEQSFLRAYEVINSTGVNAGGRSLGAVLVDEKLKIWKGEPFERAMANFYLGLIYYMEHDYNNARAAFENALFKLRDYADPKKKDAKFEEYESNFAIASIMLGRCWQRLGRDDLARANFEHVAKFKPDLAALADYTMQEQSNLLLVVDFGHGPRKVTNFDGAIVGFAPTPADEGPIPIPRVTIDGRDVPLGGLAQPPIDLLTLAQDRRWQSIDTLRTVKSAIGTGMIAGGVIEGIRGAQGSGSRQRTDLMVAGGLLAGGLLLKATSQADVREWETLPRTTFILPLRAEPGKHDITVEFPGRGLTQTWRGIEVPTTGDATYYMRMLRFSNGTFTWPPARVAQASATE